MVRVSAAVEVDQWLRGELRGDVVGVLRLLQLLDRGVVRGHVGVVVLGVVELHDLAGDGGFEFAVAIWIGPVMLAELENWEVKGRSTGQVGESGLAAHEGGAGESGARGCRSCGGADSGAQSAALEES